MPNVSVVMSVHNGRQYLESAVASVLEQDFADFEFIIIDDGSTDGSTQVLRRLAGQNRRIKLVEQENAGLTPSLNRALELVAAPYVARMDADDVSMPGRFGAQVDYLDRHPECVLVGGQVRLVDAEGRPAVASSNPPVDPSTGRATELWEEHGAIEQALLDGRWPLIHPAVMMRTAAVRQVGCYDERFVRMEDHDLFLKLAEVGRLTNLPDLLLEYRRHDEQVSGQHLIDQNYYMRVIRREGYLRRQLDLPDGLRRSAMLQSWVGSRLRRTRFWPVALRLFNTLRR